MKLNRSIAIGLVLAAGVTSGTCLAQSSNNQQETVTQSGGAQPAAVGEKTREQVMRELIEFQNSPQANQVQELYQKS
ncbi:hypothetical protein [Caballeronia sp. INDeC2]|uniref:hypothetical protein n=1 Tax=Caballeronia sp. INDeC2 TaxID=2921747 RepID=UPI00202940FC|nr:hypothetical protein [Caballeronia sp. INDeC2]